jgi:hypothetical protein
VYGAEYVLMQDLEMAASGEPNVQQQLVPEDEPGNPREHCRQGWRYMHAPGKALATSFCSVLGGLAWVTATSSENDDVQPIPTIMLGCSMGAMVGSAFWFLHISKLKSRNPDADFSGSVLC